MSSCIPTLLTKKIASVLVKGQLSELPDRVQLHLPAPNNIATCFKPVVVGPERQPPSFADGDVEKIACGALFPGFEDAQEASS